MNLKRNARNLVSSFASLNFNFHLLFLIFLSSHQVSAVITNTITFDSISGAAVGLPVRQADACTYFISGKYGTCIDPLWCGVMVPSGIAPSVLGVISSDLVNPYQPSFVFGTQIVAIFTDPVSSVCLYFFITFFFLKKGTDLHYFEK
jgi:hypothetical protein